jgi:GNAT superfamily N-acetyltransferase
MTGFAIRDAEPDDLPVLREVFRRSALSNEVDRPYLLAHPDALELSGLGVRQGRTRVAVADGRIVGFATWLGAGNVTEIDDLFVEPDWMGHGAGRALVADLVGQARARGASRVEVTANEQALGFYGRVGFVADGEAPTRFGPAPRLHLDLSAD